MIILTHRGHSHQPSSTTSSHVICKHHRHPLIYAFCTYVHTRLLTNLPSTYLLNFLLTHLPALAPAQASTSASAQFIEGHFNWVQPRSAQWSAVKVCSLQLSSIQFNFYVQALMQINMCQGQLQLLTAYADSNSTTSNTSNLCASCVHTSYYCYYYYCYNYFMRFARHQQQMLILLLPLLFHALRASPPATSACVYLKAAEINWVHFSSVQFNSVQFSSVHLS